MSELSAALKAAREYLVQTEAMAGLIAPHLGDVALTADGGVAEPGDCDWAGQEVLLTRIATLPDLAAARRIRDFRIEADVNRKRRQQEKVAERQYHLRRDQLTVRSWHSPAAIAEYERIDTESAAEIERLTGTEPLWECGGVSSQTFAVPTWSDAATGFNVDGSTVRVAIGISLAADDLRHVLDRLACCTGSAHVLVCGGWEPDKEQQAAIKKAGVSDIRKLGAAFREFVRTRTAGPALAEA
jgi:hypothetical protein